MQGSTLGCAVKACSKRLMGARPTVSSRPSSDTATCSDSDAACVRHKVPGIKLHAATAAERSAELDVGYLRFAAGI